MTDVKKFMFDKNDFNKVEKPADRAVYTEAQLVLAKEQSFEAGKIKGLEESKIQQEALISSVLDKVLTLTEELAKHEEIREKEKSIGSIKLTMQIIRKILPGFAARHPIEEIENIITNSIETRRDEPRIAVTIATEHLEFLKSKIDIITAEKSYTGKIILLADDNIANTDCRVEWADGGAERIYKSLFLNIENILNKAFSGLSGDFKGIPEENLTEDNLNLENTKKKIEEQSELEREIKPNNEEEIIEPENNN